MPMLTMTQRGFGEFAFNPEVARIAMQDPVFLRLLQTGGGEQGGDAGSFLDQWGVPLAAGAGGLAVGVLLAVLVKRKRGRKGKKGKR